MEAWMTKKGGRIATWKRRWFVLGPEKLEYFTDTDKKVQKGSVALKDVIEVGHILHETRNYCIAIRTEKRLYVASCEDEATFDAWLAKLHEIQPKQLDAEFTNVPHTSLGNIEKQWLSMVKKKKKDKDSGKEDGPPKEAAPSPDASAASASSPPSSGTTRQSNEGSADSKPGSTTVAQNGEGQSGPRSSSSVTETSLSSSTGGQTSQNGSGTEGVHEGTANATVSAQNFSASPDAASPTASTPSDSASSAPAGSAATPATTETGDKSMGAPTEANPAAPQPSSSSTGFGALHSSFDLDFGMTLNPALTAQPLEESPFAETPQTLTIPQPAPIVSHASPSEPTPFE